MTGGGSVRETMPLRVAAGFWGGSRILGPDGAELARAGETPALIMAEITLASVRHARDLLPTMRDADPLLIRDMLQSRLDATLSRKATPRTDRWRATGSPSPSPEPAAPV